MYNLPGAHQIIFDGLLNLPNAIIKRLSHFQFRPPSRADGGGLPYKGEEDARRLRGVVVGNLQILVLLWVFATKSYYIGPPMDRVGL